MPARRPQTGYLVYGAERDKEFAWLPAVPEGTVTATYRVGEEVHQTNGVGYHDHNWGNVLAAIFGEVALLGDHGRLVDGVLSSAA